MYYFITSFVQVVGDQKGAVFGGLVEAPLQPTNRKYQVVEDRSRTALDFPYKL